MGIAYLSELRGKSAASLGQRILALQKSLTIRMDGRMLSVRDSCEGRDLLRMLSFMVSFIPFEELPS
jgi:hypothetical protein